MARPGGLGKGIGAVWGENKLDTDKKEQVMIKLIDIIPNKDQPRKTFDEAALSELSVSIQKYGVLQPLLVRPMADGTYQLVAGERRWRASRMAGLSEVPVVIKDLDDIQTMEIALIENLQREDLNPIEEAEALQALIDTCGMTQEEVAANVGRSRPAIANSLRLLKLPNEIRELTRECKISAGHARALLSFTDRDNMLLVANEISSNDNITVRDVERMAKKSNRESNPGASTITRHPSFYKEAELSLSDALGRKVRVTNGKKKGTLEFEFYSLEDFKELVKTLTLSIDN